MPKIELSLHVNAPKEICFDLSRSIELHQASTGNTKERAIAGTTSGLIGMGETVTWRAKHFGIYQELTSRISAFYYPHSFTDTMVKGIFKTIEHQHIFKDEGSGTLMQDVFYFEAPFGILGRFACFLFLTKYLKKFILERNNFIKLMAEGEGWRDYIDTV
jgi:ligand-binding SRPBCC domain-containing protein